MKILVVVSSRFVQQVLKRHLAFLTQSADYCTGVTDGLRLFGAGEYDLVCVEGMLADGSGADLARRVRATPLGEHVPILLLSGNADAKTSAEAMAAGITEVFSKSDVEALADYIAHQEKDDVTAQHIKGRAMVVEDGRAIAAVFEEMLGRLGMTAQIFSRAEDALAALDTQMFDVVVTDVQLEGNMTGVGLVRAVRQLPGPIGRVPILAVSGFQDAARKVELLRLGANDYVSKPVHEEEFSARIRNMVHLARLLQEAETQRDHLRRLAMTDQLTGLYNRHYMAEVASKRVPEALKRGIAVSMIVLDLDHFKKINDTHGHDVGDVVLAETAAMLRECCRGGDIAARAGGEEFVIVLINRDAASAAGFGEQIRARLEALRPGGLLVTASVGVGTVPKGSVADFKTLFKAADEATYDAKAGGRNRVAIREVSSVAA
ncbi:MAG: diguanylate cyclase [Rhodocyclaceae bacterium]|nr:diguanylate cyclase [Rhodocyclaceae bacterium]MBK6906054.1 diguanylate cyclase [Rhodocyclaceae bacterium]